jgi:hypothetical protein
MRSSAWRAFQFRKKRSVRLVVSTQLDSQGSLRTATVEGARGSEGAREPWVRRW